jgi:hypothetical protein
MLVPVVKMTRSASPCPIEGEFDEFLFAPIGEVKDDMPLSVLSALARLDVDPWHEAAKLSLLPRACAIQKLATLIAALPETDCARLVALLPCPPRSNAWVRPALRGIDNLTLSQIVINAIFMLFIFLVAQCMVSNRLSPTLLDDSHATFSRTVLR